MDRMKRRRSKLGPRIDLPALDQFGPWPTDAGRFASDARRRRFDPLFPTDVEAGPYYCEQARKAWAVADEERARRLELEKEHAISCQAFLCRPLPEIRYVERKVDNPMPPREVIKKITIERSSPMLPSIIVTRPNEVPSPERGRFGRMGDGLDRFFRSNRA